MKLTSEVTCNRKITYTNHKQAKKALRKLNASRNREYKLMHSYRCNVCQKYHIGHKYKLYGKDIERILNNYKRGECNGNDNYGSVE